VDSRPVSTQAACSLPAKAWQVFALRSTPDYRLHGIALARQRSGYVQLDAYRQEMHKCECDI
jgi:hypothetical protein